MLNDGYVIAIQLKAIDIYVMNRIKHPVVLEGKRVKLVPLEDTYFDELIALSTNKDVWEFLSIPGYEPDTLRTELRSAVLKRMTGEEYPFVIIDKLADKVIGCTRYLDIHPQHRKLEIGWTWYDKNYWATGYNTECKYLLLTHCFETLKTIRVQLRTWDKNMRSRKAIEKIGGQFEGILRNERIRYDGSIRSTAMFSIIDDEWPGVKQMLEEKLTMG